MQINSATTGEDVEITTLQSTGDYYKVETAEDFALLVECFGYDDVADFTRCTGESADSLLNVWFNVHADRVITQ